MSERSAGAQGMSRRRARRLAPILLALAGLGGCGEDGATPGPLPALPGAGGGSASSGPGGAGPAECTEGATRDCKITLSEHNGVLTCFAGTQRCAGGTFGPCEDGTTYEQPAPERAKAEPEPTEEGGHRFRSLGSPGPCAYNPCDPACGSYDETPAESVSPQPAQVGSYSVSPDLEYLPGGFENKGLKDPNHPPTKDPCDGPADCQFDHQCNLATGFCEPYEPGEMDPSCAGANLTAAPPCNSTAIPICNRGTEPAVPTNESGIEVVIYPGNSTILQNDLGLCDQFTKQTYLGSCFYNGTIPPGECRDAVCPAGLLSGTRNVAVNPPKPPAKNAPIAECSCADNWTVYSDGADCNPIPIYDIAPVTFKETYEPICPPGTRLQWGHFAYRGGTPSNSAGTSTIKIEAQVVESPNDFPATCSGAECVTVADVPSPDPEACPLVGPSPCPKDLFTLLGGLPRASYDKLELTFTLTPAPHGTSPVYFFEPFASNARGWTLGPEWQIGATSASTGHSHQFPDPASDHTTTDDNGVAGAVLGGNISTDVHGFYYLTSPEIRLDVSGNLTLEYYRWLNSDFSPYMTNVVEVFDGTKWVRVFESANVAIGDTSWTQLTHDVTTYKNANFRVRFGYSVDKSNPWRVSGWNVDDVRIYGDHSGEVAPVLYDWDLTYSCPDSE